MASAYGVPIALVTGDEITAEETARFCPTVKAAVVKKSITRFSADSMHPDAAQELIRTQATHALSEISTAAPPAIDRPATLEISFRTSDYCELSCRIVGIERTGALSARLTGDDPLDIFRSFITAVLLCRGLVE